MRRSAFCVCTLFCGLSTAIAVPPPTVAAASVLRFALPEIADAFSARTGIRPRLSFGSSGNLRRQIAEGAPFALFLSADEAFPLDLAREGRTLGNGRIYAEGRLALLLPKASPLRSDGTLSDLGKAIVDGRLKHLAIANPETAPYGRAARQVLERIGLWYQVEPALVIGENVAQAAQFASSGTAEAGLVAYPLAVSSRLEACCRSVGIPPAMHAKMTQRGVLIKGAGEGAKAFFQFLLGSDGRDILKGHGFGLPDADNTLQLNDSPF